MDIYELVDQILAELGFEDLDKCAHEFAARIPEDELRDVVRRLAPQLFRLRLGAERRAADNGETLDDDFEPGNGFGDWASNLDNQQSGNRAKAQARADARKPHRRKGERRREVSDYVTSFVRAWLNAKSGVTDSAGYSGAVTSPLPTGWPHLRGSAVRPRRTQARPRPMRRSRRRWSGSRLTPRTCCRSRRSSSSSVNMGWPPDGPQHVTRVRVDRVTVRGRAAPHR